MEVVQGQKLLEDIGSTIDDMTADGLPSTTTEDLIQHMQETGIRNPVKAYKDMFEKEWIQNQSAKLSSIKQTGMATIASSGAGSKNPIQMKVTEANFADLFKAALEGQNG